MRTPKLIDQVRTPWGFRGILVKFKLEVGIEEPDLVDIAERSRQQSQADLMVANTLEGAADWAYLGPILGSYQRIARKELSGRTQDPGTTVLQLIVKDVTALPLENRSLPVSASSA